MRASLLVAFCVAAPLAHAAPLAFTTTLHILPVVSDFTLIVNGASEIPNLPMPTDSTKNKQVMKQMARPPRLPRGVSFRQADYGASPNATLVAFYPVQGVEATPTEAAAPAAPAARRSNEQYWEDNHLNADDYSYNNLAEVDAAPSPAAPVTQASLAPDVSGNSPGSGAGSGLGTGADPVGLSDDPTNIDKNHIPVKPDLSTGSRAASMAVGQVGSVRYSVSDIVHKLLGTIGNKTGDATPSMTDAEKMRMDMDKTSKKMSHDLQRRVLAPASYLTTSVRRTVQWARDFIPRHSFELNTDALLPSPPDPAANMSDPDVAREAARKKNIGFINIDSNRELPKPKVTQKADLVPSGLPVNSTMEVATVTQVDSSKATGPVDKTTVVKNVA